jgi:prefoldin subunit 5
MTDERIEKIKSAVEAAEHIPAEHKAELLDRLSKLKPAIAKVGQTHEEHAQSIAELVQESTQEATRREKRPEHLRAALRGLRQSVQKFEASHPELVASVNEYSTLLSAWGL